MNNKHISFHLRLVPALPAVPPADRCGPARCGRGLRGRNPAQGCNINAYSRAVSKQYRFGLWLGLRLRLRLGLGVQVVAGGEDGGRQRVGNLELPDVVTEVDGVLPAPDGEPLQLRDLRSTVNKVKTFWIFAFITISR